jgi:phospholipase/carboxylesterase
MLETKFIPAPERDSKRLMVVLHGLGDSMAGYTWVPQAMQLQWMNYLLVNAPDEYYGGYSWYEILMTGTVSSDHSHSDPTVRRSVKLLSGLLDAQRDGGFPSNETVLFGFSQGCLMTLETGLRYPHRLAALIGVSGYVLEPATLLKEAAPVAKEQRVLVTHGRQDELIPCFAVKEQMEQLRAGGIPVEWHEFNKPHTILDEEARMIREYVVKSFATR